MEKFPQEFNFQETDKLCLNCFVKNNEEKINKCRKHIHDQFVKYFESKMEYFFVDLSTYSSEIRSFIVKELCSRFPYILSARVMPCRILTDVPITVLPKISSDDKIVSPNIQEHLISCVIDSPRVLQYTQAGNIAKVDAFYWNSENVSFGLHTFPEYFVIILSKRFVDMLYNKNTRDGKLSNVFWIMD